MSSVLSTSAAVKPVETKAAAPRPVTSLIKTLYNYDVAAKTSTTAPAVFKDFGSEYQKGCYMVSHAKSTFIDLTAFVEEVYEKIYNPDQEAPTMKRTAGRLIVTAFFVSLFYTQQIRKVVAETMPILNNFYELGESIYERDFFRGFSVLEGIVDTIFNEDSNSPVAIKFEKKAKEIEDKDVEEDKVEAELEEVKTEQEVEEVKVEKQVEVKTEPKKAKEPEIEIVLVQEDDLPEDRL